MTIARAIVSELARSDSRAKCARYRSSSRKISASVERSSRSLRAIEDREEVMRDAIRDRIVSMVEFMPCRSRPGEIRRELRSHIDAFGMRASDHDARDDDRGEYRENVSDRCRGRGPGPRSRPQDPPSPGGQAGNRFGARTDPEKKGKKVPSEGPGPPRTSPCLEVENIGHTLPRKKR